MITNRNWTKARAGMAKMLVMLIIFSSVGFMGLPSAYAADDASDTASVTLGETPVESGISGRAGDNGDGLLTGTEAGTPYWQTNKAEGTTYLYMNVSDDYLFDSADYDVDVTLRYFDEGNGSFLLQYDAQSAAFKDSAKFTYTDTKTWKDYTFNLSDAKFANRTNGSDFRIAIEGGGINGEQNPDLKLASVTVKKTLKETAAPEASITLGATPVSHGITAHPGDGAADNLLTGEIGGKTYWKTNQTISPTDHGANILYFYFDVSDSYLFDNEDQDVFVTVEYYDSGSGSMKLQYDAQSAAFKDAPEFTYTNTNTWKKHTFKLGDAKFANGTNGGDFRLHVSGPGAIGANPDLYIASVSVKTQPQQNVSTETKVYDTVYPTDDVVIADMSVKDFGAAGDGVKDDTKAFQDALAAAGNRGGGVVFAPAGTYKLTSHLIVPTGVTLRGDWISPDSAGGEVKGTILAVYADKGIENGPSFLQLAPVSGVTNLSVWYPEQSLNAPVAYPWTFEQLSGDSMTVKNVTLVNSYNGIKIGPSWNELHYVRNLYGTVLKTGIFLDFTTDIGRLEHIRLASSYWAGSGLAGSPQQAELKAYTTGNTEGIVMGRSDWEYMSDIDLADFKNGMRITTRTGSLETANAQLYKINVHDSNVALKVEGVNDFGLLISDSSFKANVGVDPKAVYATEGFHSIVQFNQVTFGGTPHHAVVNEGSGVLSFENSTFENWDDQNGGYAIAAKGGSLILGQSAFSKTAKHVLLEDSVATVNSVNSGHNGSLAVTDNSDAAEVNVHQDAKYVLEQQPAVAALDLANRPKPANNSLFDITAAPYEADSTGETDVSAKIQQALDDADAAGGGTVYLPAGIYRVNNPLTVPSGVELRGSWDVPHHTIGGGTAIFTNYGENNADGAAFISLEQDAGLRGLSVYYDQQSWTNVKPYAWTVQGKGSGVYLIDTTLINPYMGVDFGTYDTSGHYIDYVAGSPLMEGIFLGGGADGGLMRNVQFNPHYYGRNNFPNHPSTDQDFDAVWSYQKENLDAFRIGDVKNETIFNTFVYGSKYGIHFEEQNGVGPEAVVIGHGTDGSKKGAVLDAAGEAGLKLINTELVSMSSSDKVYVVVGEDFDSKAVFFNSSMWGDTTRSFDIFGGDVRIQQSNFTRVGQRGINALGGDITLYDSYFQQPNTNHVYAGPDIEKLIIANNLFKGGLQLINEAGTKVTGSNLVPVALDLVKGEFDESNPANANFALKLTNMTESDPLAGKIEVIAPDSYKDKFVPVRFNGIVLGESVLVKLPYLPADTLKYKVTLDNGYSYVTQVKTAQSFATRKDDNSQVQPTIDISSSTNYSSLGGIWGGKDDLSAQANVHWDNDNLYVTVRATDNTHYQTWTNGDIWQGDSLQLGIDLSRKDGSASQNVNELGFALTNSGTVSKWRWRAPAGVAGGAFNDADAVITRDEATHQTVYDITIPLSALHGAGYTFSQEDPLGLTILLNEHDGAGRSGFIEYNQGIGTSKDATQFGDLYLLSSDYESLLEQSAEAAVAAAEQHKDVTSIDAATNFVSLLPQGTVKSGLSARLSALGGTTNPGNGPGSGSGSGSGQTDQPKVTVGANGAVQVEGKGTLDAGSKHAKLSLTAALLDQAFSKAAAGQDGKKKVTVVLPSVAGANGYSLELPSSYVNQQSPDKQIELVTPTGTILLSSDMLKPDAGKLGQTVTISIGSANTSGWSEELKKKLGDRPVVDLSIQSAGQTIDWHNSQSPVTVSLPYTPSAAEKADAKKLTVWYIDGSGKPFPVPSGQYKEAAGSIVFTTKHFSQYAVAFVQKSFSDLNGYAWAKEAIEVLAAKGITNGVSDASYAPGASIKRADFVKLLVDTFGFTTDTPGGFADVSSNRYYANAVGTAKALGITNGAGGNRFNPEAPITREEAATFIERALTVAKAGLPAGSEDVLAGFADADDISAYAKSSISSLVKAGLLQGHDGLLEPKGRLTRAEAAVLFYRIYNK
ncbi:S-layer homology domain-containing protein [Paenibacillus glycanilyticus]|uniref:S-layer homology domain-containing protein n=1 Tax=Paenibacillus glycanilyticus TaxID=126569 RepID=UPI003EBE4898